ARRPAPSCVRGSYAEARDDDFRGAGARRRLSHRNARRAWAERAPARVLASNRFPSLPASGRSPFGGAPSPSATARELVEGAELAVRLALLIEERQVAFVELPKELVPLDRLDVGVVLVVVARELDSQEARIILAAGALDVGRPAAALLDPAANLVVVRRLLGSAHRLDLHIDCKH